MLGIVVNILDCVVLVSVAGCLGYDVLAGDTLNLTHSVLFQLLVV